HVQNHWYAYLEAYENAYEPPNLYRLDLATGKPSPIATSGERYDATWLISPMGEKVGRDDYDDEGGQWRLVSTIKGSQVLMTRKGPLHSVVVHGLGRTAAAALISEAKDGGDILEEVSLFDGKVTQLADDETTDGYFYDSTGLLLGYE